MSAVKSRSRAPLRRAPREDAVTMLKDDHARVDDLFKRFAALKSGGARAADRVEDLARAPAT